MQKRFVGQNVTIGEDGAVQVLMDNGKTLRITSVEQVDDENIRVAIETGRMGKNGKVLGMYKKSEIILNKNFATTFTRDHELYHFFVDMGMLTPQDRLAIMGEFKRLQAFGLAKFKANKSREENEANTFAQMLHDREKYRETKLGRIMQKVTDFIDAIMHRNNFV